MASPGLAGIVFLATGMLKNAVYGVPVSRPGPCTPLMGNAAEGLAFATGYFAQGLLGG
mgnify:CR=1 FL=1